MTSKNKFSIGSANNNTSAAIEIINREEAIESGDEELVRVSERLAAINSINSIADHMGGKVSNVGNIEAKEKAQRKMSGEISLDERHDIEMEIIKLTAQLTTIKRSKALM